MTASNGEHLDPQSIADGYTANAEYWIDVIRHQRDRYYEELTRPALLNAIGDCVDADIVDVGCGEGSFTRLLLDRGAASVCGVDACLPLIDAARSAGPSDDRLTFWHADAAELPLRTASADLVVANRIPHAINNPEQRFHEFARVLRPGGRLVLLSQHPCFYTGQVGAHSAPVEASEYFEGRIVQQHFSVNGKRSPAPSVQPIYSLESYLAMIVGAGFVVTDLKEPHPTALQRQDPWWAENFTHPMFLLINGKLA